ncbi:hypothetical protein H6F50_12030 [Coleofasciculus sp. FACHB-712]|uniref:hypothetical protein n=1 Tax=Cyanophyceae TaxID=3028117 RepID=UPI001684F83E|nr:MULTISPECIES: hypothetical protein [unclassified Coleofasciculus]MBD1900905.1 hypothetical protein [Coleofasciculus sp. FACHB-125]MBD1943081.1 hypothetical protein [Coleofasciculus sp. FACHB-712]
MATDFSHLNVRAIASHLSPEQGEQDDATTTRYADTGCDRCFDQESCSMRSHTLDVEDEQCDRSRLKLGQ